MAAKKTNTADVWVVYSELSDGIMKEVNINFDDAYDYMKKHLYDWKMPNESIETCKSRYKIIRAKIKYES